MTPPNNSSGNSGNPKNSGSSGGSGTQGNSANGGRPGNPGNSALSGIANRPGPVSAGASGTASRPDLPSAKDSKDPKNPKEPPESGLVFRTVFLLGVIGTLLLMLVGGVILWHFSNGLPSIITVADYRPLGVTRVLAEGKTDAEIGEFFKERRYLVPYDKVPSLLVYAFVSAEDDRFFEHPGINILSIIRAGIANFKAGHVVQGGSTITQQVAKSLLLTSERSIDRKIKEVILASRIERNLTKQQILYLYLNQIYLGHGAYGVQAASRTYFRKDVAAINLAEAALLAGMPQAPGKYSPLLNPKRAKERQIYVLRRMVENKYISQSEMDEAMKEPLKIFHDEDINSKYSPYYVEYIRKYLVDKYGEKATYEDGLTVSVPTTPQLAQVATKSVREGLLIVDKRMGYRGPVQHLKDGEEIRKFLETMRLKLIAKKIQFQLFLPDGRIDSIEAMRYANITSDAGLLDPDEFYQGVVIGFDDKKKTAKIMIGAAKAELPLEKMRWARSPRDDKNPTAPRPEPSLPSKVLQKGDVILVSIVRPVASPGASAAADDLVVALEQNPGVQGSLLSLDVDTGNVLAMVGGYDFDQSEFNRAIQASRQVGSAFKPIIYAAALEKGFTPNSVIVDSPVVFKDLDGENKWKPNNFESKFYGDTTFRQALIKSRNIPTVKIVQSIQVPYLIQYARRLGMTSAFNADLSISLGSSSSSLLDLTKIYALFPRMGRKINPIFITKVIDRDGKILEEQEPTFALKVTPPPVDPAAAGLAAAEGHLNNQPGGPPVPNPSPSSSRTIVFPEYPLASDPNQVLDPRVAYVMTHLMKEVVVFGTGHEAKNLGRLSAGKTGTTSDYIDAWFLGFTPHVVTGVWVGFDNQKSIGPAETGARSALPIWLSFMKEAVKTYPESDFVPPPGVVFASIDGATGKLAPPNSSSSIREAFIEGTEPTEALDIEKEADTDSQSDFFKEDRD